MQRILLLVIAALLAPVAHASSLGQAREIARKYPLIDTHIDVPYRLNKEWEDVTRSTEKGDFDYPRAVSGGLDVPFMSIYIPAKLEGTGEGIALADNLIESVEAIVGRAPDKFRMVYSPKDVEKHFEPGRVLLAMGMENGTPIEGDLANLEYFYQRGIRYITLAHSKANHISDSSYDDNRPWGGLSPFGRELVAEMNKLGMMVDVSHLTDDAIFDVLEVSKAPVIASHSSPRHFTPDWERNLSDELIIAIAKTGGVVAVNFGSTFVSPKSRAYQDKFNEARDHFKISYRYTENDDPAVKEFEEKYKKKLPFEYATLNDVLDNFDHVVKLVGIDYVGIGSDFDGVGDSLPEGLKDVSAYPSLIAGLLDRGYSENDIRKIMSGNIMRLWATVEDHAAGH